MARSEGPVDTADAARFRALLERRLSGEPTAYILGEREFYGRSFIVDSRVLIPRPETEHLIEAALGLELPDRPSILDVGTGSGAIAITLALEAPGSRIVGCDRSPAALAVAAANSSRLGTDDRVRFVAGDLVTALDLGAFDLVVSNPPYIDPAVRDELSVEVTGFEPPAALFAADAGTATLARLVRDMDRSGSGAPLILEIGHDQAEAIVEIATSTGFGPPKIVADLAGHPRIAVLEREP